MPEVKAKEYTIVKHIVHYRGNRETGMIEVTGTFEYLLGYFGYTLECLPFPRNGIVKPIKTIRSLISNINKAYEYRESGTYTRSSVELKSK